MNMQITKQEQFELVYKNNLVLILPELLRDSRVDPSAQDNWAIIWASANEHTEIVRLLLADSRVRDKLSSEQITRYEKQILII